MKTILKLFLVFCLTAAATPAQVTADADRYQVNADVRIPTRDGTPIAAIVVLDREAQGPQPTALFYTVYVTERDELIAQYAARKGYASVIAYTRGVRTGVTDVVPYEHDAEDASDVIDWISRQPWSDGRVGMYGGSYAGFAQWAAARLRPPALKTIVPGVAAAPGIGEPMERNVFMSVLAYNWPMANIERYVLPRDIFERWFASGKPYSAMDELAGRANPSFQRWIRHPSFDAYWRSITTHGDQFKIIDIPVLTTTGYYDDAQAGALYYFREHLRQNPAAAHYLVIGPYDHFGGQINARPELMGYAIDPVAVQSMGDLAFAWFDYILKGREKPALVQDRVNFEVMGANRWRHAGSLAAMHNRKLRLFLGMAETGGQLALTPVQPDPDRFHPQTVDFADRDHTINYYMTVIPSKELQSGNGLVFTSAPLEREAELNGAWSGELHVAINKRDMDILLALYAWLPDRTYFFLNRYLGRASFAANPSRRRLLVPGEKTTVAIADTRVTSRLLPAGSRLVIQLSINKNPYEQINYGTGGDVSAESIVDAAEPLSIKWYADSFIEFPLWEE
jgi:predicted acyl esterase